MLMVKELLMPIAPAISRSWDVARMARPSSVFVTMNQRSSSTAALTA